MESTCRCNSTCMVLPMYFLAATGLISVRATRTFCLGWSNFHGIFFSEIENDKHVGLHSAGLGLRIRKGRVRKKYVWVLLSAERAFWSQGTHEALHEPCLSISTQAKTHCSGRRHQRRHLGLYRAGLGLGSGRGRVSKIQQGRAVRGAERAFWSRQA